MLITKDKVNIVAIKIIFGVVNMHAIATKILSHKVKINKII